MRNRVIEAAVNEAVEGRPAANHLDASRACERAIDNLRNHGRGQTAYSRIREAWVCTLDLRERYLNDAEFHAAVNVMAELAVAAAFGDLPITDAEERSRAHAIETLASGFSTGSTPTIREGP